MQNGPRPGGGFGGGGPRFGGFAMPSVSPIKAFVRARARSVIDQMAGKSEGQKLDDFGPGGPGGPPGRGPGGRGGPGMFGPGMFLGNIFMSAFDSDKDEHLTRDEFTQGFDKWFDAWNTDKSGLLTEDQLRNGMNQEFNPFRGGPPGGPGGPPPSARP